jgi:methylmalonyl-CoA mutase
MAAAPTYADWAALAEKSLGPTAGKRTRDGVGIKPLYTADDAPAAASFARAAHDPERPWDVRALVAHPDPAAANRQVLEALEGGASSVLVRIADGARAGVQVASADDLALVLDGVILELAPIALDAGFLGPLAAEWLGDAAKSSPAALPAFHLDPLSAFARAGRSPGPIGAHVEAAAAVAARYVSAYPRASLFLASGEAVHEAGGDAATELGFAAASALAYAKALNAAGVPPAAALARITLGLAADAQVYLTIAKLRAARLIWAQITGACGVQAPARIEARSSARMLAAKDVWTNMVRLTLAGFAAAAGGADAIVLAAFTDSIGAPTDLALRQARGAQAILMEEAGVGRVTDPARGGWFLEALTGRLARAGWAAFQGIEAEGGAAAALASGHVAWAVESAREAEPAAVVGVSAFPNPDDLPPPTAKVEPPTPAPEVPRQPGEDSLCRPLAPLPYPGAAP